MWSAPLDGGAVWRELQQWVANGTALLHGSHTSGLTQLDPQSPHDLSADDYSKRRAVFATEDPTWAMAYAIRQPGCRRFLNACFYPGAKAATPAERQIYLSYAAAHDGSPPLGQGVVYVLPREHFQRMPSYRDATFGTITECQWSAFGPVPVHAEVLVTPGDLPVEPTIHDFESVRARIELDPSGFPWED